MCSCSGSNIALFIPFIIIIIIMGLLDGFGSFFSSIGDFLKPAYNAVKDYVMPHVGNFVTDLFGIKKTTGDGANGGSVNSGDISKAIMDHAGNIIKPYVNDAASWAANKIFDNVFAPYG